jgi:hypothetical protein
MTNAGYHDYPERDERRPDRFVVFRVNDGWYWQLVSDMKVPRGMPNGPWDSDDEAYINAMR